MGLPAYGGYGYGGYGYGKRSADAEAKPWYGYGGLYGYGLPAYGAYGLGYGYGKRSADAEAEAKPWYGYGGLYGYGLPAYGGYGYGGYGYGKRAADAEAKPWYGWWPLRLRTPSLRCLWRLRLRKVIYLHYNHLQQTRTDWLIQRFLDWRPLIRKNLLLLD